MSVAVRVAVGLLVVAHGLVHLLFVAEDVPEFTFDGSWLLPDGGTARAVGFALMAGSVGVFALAGAAVCGLPGLAGWWAVLTIVAAVLSLLLVVAVARPDFGLRLSS